MATAITGDDVLRALDRPIAFQRVFVDVTGSVAGAVMLSQMVYWQRRCADPAGWWFKSREDWTEEVGVTRREQETARAAMLTRGVLQEETRGIPRRLYFRLDVQVLGELVANASRPEVTSQSVTSDQQAGEIEPASGSHVTSKKARNRPASRSHLTSKLGGNVPPLRSQYETSSETTEEIKKESEQPAAPAISPALDSGFQTSGRDSKPTAGPRLAAMPPSRPRSVTQEELDELRQQVNQALFPGLPMKVWLRGQPLEWEKLWRLCAGESEEACQVARAGQARCAAAGQAVTLQGLLQRWDSWATAANQPAPQPGGKRDVGAGNAALIAAIAGGGS